MVMFGQNRAEIQDSYNEAAANPYDPLRDSPPGLFEGIPSAVGFGPAKTMSNMELYKSGVEMLLGDEQAKQQHDQLIRENMALHPDPQVTGYVGRALYGLTNLGSEMAAGFIAGEIVNPLGGGVAGMTVMPAALEAYALDQSLQKQIDPATGKPVDPSTAAEAAVGTAAMTYMGFRLPVSMTGGFAKRFVSGGAVNELMTITQTAQTAAILDANGYHDMAKQYKINDLAENVAAFLLGGGIGGTFGKPSPKSALDISLAAAGIKPLPSEIDLALAANNIHQLEIESAPGIPTDIATRNAHIEAMTKATDQLLQGEPVAVGDGMLQANFLPKHIEEGIQKEAVKAVDDYLAEHQIVYHGTPHEFDEFSLQHVGTGEGAAAYGHGLYFTNNKEIAGFYKESLSNQKVFIDGAAHTVGEILKGKLVSEDEAFALQEMIDRDLHTALGFKKGLEELAAELKQENESSLSAAAASLAKKMSEGKIYETKIPNNEHLLDWNLPFTEQPKPVKQALIKAGIDPTMASGAHIYRALEDKLGSAKAASEYLASIGIPGHRYFADMQRGKRGEAGYNYVIYDEAAAKKVKPETPKTEAPKVADTTKEQSPEISAAQQIAAEKPSLEIVHDDGTVSTVAEALAQADEEIARAEKDASLFAAAINCFIRNGE